MAVEIEGYLKMLPVFGNPQQREQRDENSTELSSFPILRLYNLAICICKNYALYKLLGVSLLFIPWVMAVGWPCSFACDLSFPAIALVSYPDSSTLLLFLWLLRSLCSSFHCFHPSTGFSCIVFLWDFCIFPPSETFDAHCVEISVVAPLIHTVARGGKTKRQWVDGHRSCGGIGQGSGLRLKLSSFTGRHIALGKSINSLSFSFLIRKMEIIVTCNEHFRRYCKANNWSAVDTWCLWKTKANQDIAKNWVPLKMKTFLKVHWEKDVANRQKMELSSERHTNIFNPVWNPQSHTQMCVWFCMILYIMWENFLWQRLWSMCIILLIRQGVFIDSSLRERHCSGSGDREWTRQTSLSLPEL